MKISIVIPVYNEQDSLLLLYNKIIENIYKSIEKKLIDDYEIIWISDGCTDNSENIIKDIIKKDSKVKLIVFRKNFGKAAALQAGFNHCEGDIVITMDADLQDDPEGIENFVNKLNEGYDLVSGWKYNRNDPLEKRLPSKLFNKVTSKLSGIELHDFNCGFKAYRKEVIKNINLYGELHRYIPVLAHRKGFRISEIIVKHNKREFGKSKYGFERYFRGLFDSITTSFLAKYYDRPMHFFGKIGMLLFTIGILLCGYLTVEWFVGNPIGTRPLLILGVLLILVGFQSFSIGLIGDMLVDATYKYRYSESHIKEII